MLEYQKSHYPRAATVGDADALYARIEGELAKQGDAQAAEWVREHAATTSGPTTAGPTTAGCATDDDDPRIVALNALLQMDGDDAIPILKKLKFHEDKEIRDAVASALDRVGTP